MQGITIALLALLPAAVALAAPETGGGGGGGMDWGPFSAAFSALGRTIQETADTASQALDGAV